MPRPMAGRVCLITGASSGIGRVVAEQLAARGARVLAHARDPDKAARVCDAIKARTGNHQVEPLLADFASLAQVRALADAVRARTNKLDVLVNNAGALIWERAITADGYERTFAVNHLAPFLLIRELLPLIEASAPARIVTVASGTHARVSLDLDDLMSERGYSPRRAYARSKLCNVLFTCELARRLEGRGVTANCTRPGFVRTAFARTGNPWWVALGAAIGQVFGRSPERGALGTVALACEPELEEVNGCYYFDRRAIPSSEESRDPELARRLWALSERLVDRALAATSA